MRTLRAVMFPVACLFTAACALEEETAGPAEEPQAGQAAGKVEEPDQENNTRKAPGPRDRPDGPKGGSIHPAENSTEEGDTYVGGALVVDHVHRQYAQEVMSVDIRLHNRTDKPFEGAFLIEFRSRNGEPILGHKTEFEDLYIEPFGYAVVSNSALVSGAVGFRLFVKSKGSAFPGYADPDRIRAGAD